MLHPAECNEHRHLATEAKRTTRLAHEPLKCGAKVMIQRNHFSYQTTLQVEANESPTYANAPENGPHSSAYLTPAEAEDEGLEARSVGPALLHHVPQSLLERVDMLARHEVQQQLRAATHLHSQTNVRCGTGRRHHRMSKPDPRS